MNFYKFNTSKIIKNSLKEDSYVGTSEHTSEQLKEDSEDPIQINDKTELITTFDRKNIYSEYYKPYIQYPEEIFSVEKIKASKLKNDIFKDYVVLKFKKPIAWYENNIFKDCLSILEFLGLYKKQKMYLFFNKYDSLFTIFLNEEINALTGFLENEYFKVT
jgi:hypothetical protein